MGFQSRSIGSFLKTSGVTRARSSNKPSCVHNGHDENGATIERNDSRKQPLCGEECPSPTGTIEEHCALPADGPRRRPGSCMASRTVSGERAVLLDCSRWRRAFLTTKRLFARIVPLDRCSIFIMTIVNA